jgi:hypothetical protein
LLSVKSLTLETMEAEMRMITAIVVMILMAAGVSAQQDRTSQGPLTWQEAELMNSVWPQIRTAAAFEEIDWESVGLDGPPGDAEARRLMAAHWGTLREANQFREINWQATTGYSASSVRPFAQQDPEPRTGLFTRREAGLMSAVWPEIRRYRRFEAIDWESVGLSGAPGDAEARGLMMAHWEALRQAAEFSDIDWQATASFRAR